MKDKTILFVMPRLPFPATSGRKTSLYNYCKILSESFGYRLIVAAFLEENDEPNLCPSFIDKLIILPEASKITKIKNILFKSFLLKKMPIQTSIYYNKTVKSIIDDIIVSEKVDICIADMVRTTEYLKNVKCYKIADLDDRISLRYERQLKTDFKNVNPYGAFINRFPKLIQKFLFLPIIKKIVTKNEIMLLKKYEIEVGKIFDKTIFVAKKECEKFNEELGETKAFPVPIGVDINYFNSKNVSLTEEKYIGFLGALNVAHNENAVRYFINDILPLILKKNNNIKFLIIGGGASESLKSLQSSNIVFTGRVDDVRDYLNNCSVFVCPLRFGSGIKTKNLEAMAMGLPVVTTSIGAENINAESGKHWIICDDEKEFANNVLELIANKSLRSEIGKNAEKYINDNWTWDLAKKSFEDLIKKGE